MHVRLIIPEIEEHQLLTQGYLSAIADIAGGFTSWQGIGGWKDGKGDLIVEPVTIVESDIRSDLQDDSLTIRMLRDLARTIARDLQQECVYLAIDGRVEYVKPE